MINARSFSCIYHGTDQCLWRQQDYQSLLSVTHRQNNSKFNEQGTPSNYELLFLLFFACYSIQFFCLWTLGHWIGSRSLLLFFLYMVTFILNIRYSVAMNSRDQIDQEHCIDDEHYHAHMHNYEWHDHTPEYVHEFGTSCS